MAEMTDEELLDALGVEAWIAPKPLKTPREERIIAGFEDVEHFFEKHGRPPTHGEDKDIFERLYAVRLDRIRGSDECRSLLIGLDKYGLLQERITTGNDPLTDLDDDVLLAELGVLHSSDCDVTKVTHVRTRAEIRAAEDVARRNTCLDFAQFSPLFSKVQQDLNTGIRETREFKDNARIQREDLFILGGQKVYVAEVGDEFINEYGRPDRRLRVIYDNGTESDILMRSLQRALNKDEMGRRIVDADIGPLFSDRSEDSDHASGTIYVLRSKSNHPLIQKNRDVIHKIGVTGGDIKKRIVAAKTDPTFLMDDVDIVATYELSNIDRTKLENLIHRFFDPVRMDIEVTDRFGKPVVPREWFLVPLFIIDEAIKRIRDGSIVNCVYNPEAGQIIELTN